MCFSRFKIFVVPFGKFNYQPKRQKMTDTGLTLVAFDFDHTIVDGNSDTYVVRLAENGRLPDSIKKSYASGGWTQYMNRVFQHLHGLGVTPQQMLECVSGMTWTPGMKDLLTALDQSRHELIVISDSNSAFIGSVLEAAGLSHVFKGVMTNPAVFEDSGLLRIAPYHNQDWCKLSDPNLCKGHILEEYVKNRRGEGVRFDRLAFVGDGRNDFCPSLRLGEADLVFPRSSMSLASMLADPNREKTRASVHEWKTGWDILAVLQPGAQ